MFSQSASILSIVLCTVAGFSVIFSLSYLLSSSSNLIALSSYNYLVADSDPHSVILESNVLMSSPTTFSPLRTKALTRNGWRRMAFRTAQSWRLFYMERYPTAARRRTLKPGHPSRPTSLRPKTTSKSGIRHLDRVATEPTTWSESRKTSKISHMQQRRTGQK